MISFVLGGAKSGKTSWALKYGENLTSFREFYYLATAIPFDSEMKRKIEKHREERSHIWQLIEEPLEIAQVLKRLKGRDAVILIDCLTLWLSNLLYYKKPVETFIENFLEELKAFKAHLRGWVILVSNELGLGLVPESELGRNFRELAGVLHQRVAGIADETFFIIAGLSLTLKGRSDGIDSGNLP